MRSFLFSALLPCCAIAGSCLTAPATAPEPRALIQVALLLDTSNSMDGLINQAKSQLWSFVNTFAPLHKKGKTPELQVALYEYGKSRIPSGEGYMRQVLPFTTDLDRVSQELFALTTCGGEEFCGQVIRNAVQGLNWSPSSQDLKVIFIAGNEPFTQGTVDYRSSCETAKSHGIHVNTIFCGNYQEGTTTRWADGARLGSGAYMNIDQDQRIIHIPAPQDQEIEKLGLELNHTYIPVGEAGIAAYANQSAQDTNAINIGSGALNQRAKAKASSFYRNESWDLVDGDKAGTHKLEVVKKKDLPKALQSMSLTELRAHVDAKAKKRTEIQVRIRVLSVEREKFIAAKRKEREVKGTAHTLDAAMIEALSAQAAAHGFTKN
jgi:hypothetical protein